MAVQTQEFLKYLVPESIDCKRIRFGEKADGGYVVVDDHLSDVRGILSFGVGPTYLFEEQFAALHPLAEVFLFDHTVEAPTNLPERVSFEKRGVGVGDSDLPALGGYVQDIVCSRPGRWILKMDIEGHEWEVLRQVNEQSLAIFDQLVIEFHHWRQDPDIYTDVYRKLYEYFAVVHVHANNHAGLLQCGHHSVPEVLEVTYLRRTPERVFRPGQECFPTEIDYPNDPTRSEIILDFWPFRKSSN